jgi:phenylacetate-CoA ligase
VPVADGAWGEITVTGGRNPYVPLLRYRTGDRGRMAGGRLLALEGRAPVVFRATDGAPVKAVDVGRVLRDAAELVQHEMAQGADGACVLRLRPVPGVAIDVDAIEHGLRALLGRDAALTITVDPRLGESGKVAPYRVEAAPGDR